MRGRRDPCVGLGSTEADSEMKGRCRPRARTCSQEKALRERGKEEWAKVAASQQKFSPQPDPAGELCSEYHIPQTVPSQGKGAELSYSCAVRLWLKAILGLEWGT